MNKPPDQRPDPFVSTAWYYARYRKPYPQEFFDMVCERFQLDGTGRLLDVGCGTGQIAIPLSEKFEEVVAVDESAEMIAEATRLVSAAAITKVRLLVMPGEDISPDLGKFRLAVFGSSLHWMRIDDVLRKCRAVLARNGSVAVVDMRSFWGGTSDWERQVVATVQRWLGAERRTGVGPFVGPVRLYEASLPESRFTNIQSGHLPCTFDLDLPFIVGHLYSTSYCSRSLLGPRAPDFERDLGNSLLTLDRTGRFRWKVDVNYIFADRA